MFGRILVAALAVLLFAPGCYSPARRLDVVAVKPITVGMARAEVELHLGEPREREKGSNGVMIARYFFHEFHRSEEASPNGRFHNPGELLYRTLTLLYNPGGILEKKLHDESVSPLHREWNGWIELGPPLTAETVRIAKGTDTSKSLIGRFGEPTVRTLDANGRLLFEWFYFRGRDDRLGQPTAKLLTVALDSDVAQDFTLNEADPRFWPYLRFFR